MQVKLEIKGEVSWARDWPIYGRKRMTANISCKQNNEYATKIFKQEDGDKSLKRLLPLVQWTL